MHTWLMTYVDRDTLLKTDAPLMQETLEKAQQISNTSISRKILKKRFKQFIWRALRDRKELVLK